MSRKHRTKAWADIWTFPKKKRELLTCKKWCCIDIHAVLSPAVRGVWLYIEPNIIMCSHLDEYILQIYLDTHECTNELRHRFKLKPIMISCQQQQHSDQRSITTWQQRRVPECPRTPLVWWFCCRGGQGMTCCLSGGQSDDSLIRRNCVLCVELIL